MFNPTSVYTELFTGSKNQMLKIYNITVFVILAGSAMQFGDFIISRYFAPMVALFSSIIIYLSYSKIKTNKIVTQVFWVHFFSFLGLFFLSLLGRAPIEESVFDFIKLFFAFGLSYFAFVSVYFSSEKAIRVAVITTALVVFLVFFLDSTVRFQNFQYDSFLSNFYIFKVNSPFFVDTNALALFGLFYFSIFFYYYKYSKANDSTIFLIALLLLLVFILLSFSRSAAVALFSVILFHLFFTRKIQIKLLLLIFSISIFVLMLPSIAQIIGSDGSGATKFGVYQNFIENFGLYDARGTFFGYGINEGNYAYSYEQGKYSHAMLPMIAGHFGFIGLIIYFSFFGYLAVLSKGHTLYAFIPAFVAGLSYIHPFLETLFLATGFILALYLRNNRYEKY